MNESTTSVRQATPPLPFITGTVRPLHFPMPMPLIIHNMAFVDTSSRPSHLSRAVADSFVHVAPDNRQFFTHEGCLVIVYYCPVASAVLVAFDEHALVDISVGS